MSDDERQWEIKVSVPMRLPVEQRQELFSAVVAAVEEWEPAPADRDEWDADVAGCPADEWSEIVALSSSRQAWAEEALRLDEAIKQTIERYEVQAQKAEDKLGEHPDALMANACWKRAATWLSEATSDKQIAADTVSDSNAASARPQCTVHPANGGSQ